jgi:hypothetical protein
MHTTRLPVLLASISTFAALAASTPAQAELFAGASALRSEWPTSSCGPGSCDRHGSGWAVRAGYMFLPWLGLEARAFDLGESRNPLDLSNGGGVSTGPGDLGLSSHDSSAKGSGLGAALAFPLAEGFYLTGVAGMARTRTQGYSFTTISGSTGTVTSASAFRASDWEPYYGVGVEYFFTRQIAVTLDAQRYQLPGKELGAPKHLDTLGVGVTFRFR